jgi:hypothetical protein
MDKGNRMNGYAFLRFYFEFSDGKRVEPSVDIANTVLVRNMRVPPENLTQKSIGKCMLFQAVLRFRRFLALQLYFSQGIQLWSLQ